MHFTETIILKIQPYSLQQINLHVSEKNSTLKEWGLSVLRNTTEAGVRRDACNCIKVFLGVLPAPLLLG